LLILSIRASGRLTWWFDHLPPIGVSFLLMTKEHFKKSNSNQAASFDK